RVCANTSPNDSWQIRIRHFMLARGCIRWFCMPRLLLVVISVKSVPTRLTGRTLLEALHGPHVLAWPATHVTFDHAAHGRNGHINVFAVYLLRRSFENHLEARAILQAQRMQKHAYRLAASEHTGDEFAGQCLSGEKGHEDA